MGQTSPLTAPKSNAREQTPTAKTQEQTDFSRRLPGILALLYSAIKGKSKSWISTT